MGLASNISLRFAFARPERARELRLEFTFGTGASVTFKFLLRYGDLPRCLWDLVHCDVFYTRMRFYVEGHKNAAHGCVFLDIARPAGDIYFVAVRAKASFRTGCMLRHIDHRTGAVDRTRTMSI
jgi:hypothetical protein